MTSALHRVAGGLAILIIAGFWTSTVTVELFGSTEAIILVKTLIAWGLLVLVPALMLAGMSGLRLARGWDSEEVRRKKRRMPLIVGNGVLVLVPSALFLAYKAQQGAFDASFAAVQGLELLAGAANFVLLGLNARDGMRMARRNR